MSELRRRNLEAIKSLQPDLQRLLARDGSGGAVLAPVGAEDVDIAVGTRRLYGDGAKAFAAKQMAWFLADPNRNRLAVAAPDRYQADPFADRFLVDLLARAAAEGVAFADRRVDARAPHLIVLGMGLGFHLPPALDALRPRYLILAEPNIDFLRLSLDVFDWTAFLGAARAGECAVRIFVDADPGRLLHGISEYIRTRCDAGLLDGTAVLQHYGTPVFQAVAQGLFAHPDALAAQLGFLDDEFWMVRNTVFNLKDADVSIIRRPWPRHDLPAFVIGAGPSLDAALPVIRENADRALIVSVGTTLRALLTAGIVPDFQLELENVPEVYRVTKSLASERDLGDVTLLASTTVDPRLKTLFGRTLMFLRRDLAVSAMFDMGPAANLENAMPNVVNLGLSFAREIGAPEIYMFGIDLGTKDPARVHTTVSPYSLGELRDDWPLDLRRPGNFGGTVHTETGYIVAKDVAEHEIRSHGGRSYFNCGDGMAIAGAKPLRPDRVRIASGGPDKKAVVAAILAGTRPYTRAEFEAAWRPDDTTAAIRAEAEAMRAPLLAAADADGLTRAMDDAVRRLTAMPPTAVKYYAQGTYRLAVAAAYAWLSRAETEKDRARFARIARDATAELWTVMADAVAGFHDGLQRRPEDAWAAYFSDSKP